MEEISDKTRQERLNSLQIREIKEHRWYLSEKRGSDIGDNAAALDWSLDACPENNGLTHAERFRETYTRNEEAIHKMCSSYCGNACKGADECPMPKGKLHELLED